MELASTRLSQLIGKISTLHGNMQLDITAGSMSGTPAATVYDTMLSDVAFVIDYFNYIEVPHFLVDRKRSQLSEKLMEDFFGKLTERTLGKNLRIGDMARRITDCAFTHLLGHIVTKEQDAVGVSFRRSRPAAEETCTRWMRLRMIKVSFGCYLTFVMISCSVFDLWKCQSALGEGKTISKHLCDKMLYVGQINGCQKILISMQSTAQKKISRS